jgi:uncharacterized membrane protein
MFEFLFKYPLTVFSKGQFVLLASWPVWMLGLAVLAVAAALAWQFRRLASRLTIPRSAAIWGLQTVLIALLLLLLWRPAISIATLKPQQNIIAVLVDDSRSMALREDSGTRREQALAVLNDGLLSDLEQKFQVRTYRFGKDFERIETLGRLTSESGASRVGDALRQVAAESTSLPVGAVVLLSDGADNSGGIDLDTMAELRRRRIPVHTIGFGREQFTRDIEIREASVPARALADSRLSASITLRSRGYRGQKARLSVREGGKVLAVQQVTLKGDGEEQIESMLFNAGSPGARNLEVAVDPLEGEENAKNNTVTRLVNVEAVRPRILYLEGEPRWELKFIRRAVEDDRSLHLVTMLRPTENKIYRQGVSAPTELEQGFPSKAEELFSYQALVLGSVQSGYLTGAQQELVKEFVDRRGGGLLFLGGRAALAEGGYARPPFADLLPVSLPEKKITFRREPATVELTPAGRDNIICRLLEQPEANAERWKKLPALADYQEIGAPKPGAVALAHLTAANRTLPLLVTQNYGRGRTAVLATGGTWRWQMLQDHTDMTHEMFWQQLLRWLVTSAPGQVVGSTPRAVLSDEERVLLRTDVRDKTFRPVSDAHVEARLIGPDGLSETVNLRPVEKEEGAYSAEWTAERPGSYLAEISVQRGDEELGRDVVMFRREDGVAENFRAEQNRLLLEKLAEQTGGRYWKPKDARKLAREVNYSEAGIAVREARDVWDMPFVFFLALVLRSSEWLLRRKWGVV